MDPRKNPYAVLLAKLSKVQPAKKARQGWQQLMHESYQEKVKPEVERAWAQKVQAENLSADMKPDAAFRSSICRNVFNAMSREERDAIMLRAKEEARIAKRTWEAVLNNPPSRAPVDRQR
jgi:hypothetical protein